MTRSSLRRSDCNHYVAINACAQSLATAYLITSNNNNKNETMDENGNLTPDDVDLMDDLKLMGFGESDSSGAWIKLQVMPEHLDKFRGLKGELFEITMRLLDNSHKPVRTPVAKEYGGNANILFRAGFFYNPKVVTHIGTDEEYQDYVRLKRCIICGGFTSIYEEGENAGEGYCDYAHIRRVAAGAGTGEKPLYSGVPMCNKHHRLQHSAGELAPYNEYMKIKGKETTPNAAVARHWFEEQGSKMLAEWAHKKFANDFGYASLASVPPKKIIDWCNKVGVIYYLPAGFSATDGAA